MYKSPRARRSLCRHGASELELCRIVYNPAGRRGYHRICDDPVQRCAKALVHSGKYKGGHVVVLEDMTTWRCTKKDIVNNSLYVKASPI